MITPRTTKFLLREEKKHSVRYDAASTDIDPLATGVYVSKLVLARPYPREIWLTLHLSEPASHDVI
jgi:hypothetical protein